MRDYNVILYAPDKKTALCQLPFQAETRYVARVMLIERLTRDTQFEGMCVSLFLPYVRARVGEDMRVKLMPDDFTIKNFLFSSKEKVEKELAVLS